jgi:hypothetical protein
MSVRRATDELRIDEIPKADATKSFLELPVPVSRGQRQVEAVNGYVKFLAAQGFAPGPLAALQRQREWKTSVENEVQGKRQRQITPLIFVYSVVASSSKYAYAYIHRSKCEAVYKHKEDECTFDFCVFFFLGCGGCVLVPSQTTATAVASAISATDNADPRDQFCPF